MERESDIMTCTVSMAGPTPSPPMSKWIQCLQAYGWFHTSSSIPSKYVSSQSWEVLLLIQHLKHFTLQKNPDRQSLNWTKIMWGVVHTNREHHQADVHQNKQKDLHHRAVIGSKFSRCRFSLWELPDNNAYQLSASSSVCVPKDRNIWCTV